MPVCPAGLTVKWRDEMAEKFGLDFTVVDTERCALVRRTHGSAANPFKVYPLSIVSLPWLRGPKAQRLLAERRCWRAPTAPGPQRTSTKPSRCSSGQANPSRRTSGLGGVSVPVG
jgi:hypothetical protein